MKKLFSIKYSTAAFNMGTFLLRIALGLALMMNHGFVKLTNFPTMKDKFMNFLNLGSTTSLALITFAEFFCGLLLILGLFTRLAAAVIVIGMGVAFFIAHKAVFDSEGEKALVFAAVAFLFLMIGPGRISVDGAVSK